MARTVAFEVPLDTSLFTPLQLQPRSLLAYGMQGWARWLLEHWVSFPKLVSHHGLGAVVAGFDLEYCRPFGFFDADSLAVTFGVRVREDGRLIFVEADFAPPGAAPVVHATGVLRAIRIGEGLGLSAIPVSIGEEIVGQFQMDEVVPRSSRRRLDTTVDDLAVGGPPDATLARSFTIWRHMCEVADQWSAIAVPDFAAAVREELASTHGNDCPSLAAGLTRPLSRIAMEFHQAAFFLDSIRVECEAFGSRDPAFVHRFCGDADPCGRPLATVVEWFSGEGTNASR